MASVLCGKVALCSAHYALLTPVTEAFLALLFPFVWQVRQRHTIASRSARVGERPVMADSEAMVACRYRSDSVCVVVTAGCADPRDALSHDRHPRGARALLRRAAQVNPLTPTPGSIRACMAPVPLVLHLATVSTALLLGWS